MLAPTDATLLTELVKLSAALITLLAAVLALCKVRQRQQPIEATLLKKI
jgi:hypothetical protein